MTTQAAAHYALQIARRCLEGSTYHDWREAGYTDALDCARAIVGDSGTHEVDERAAEIVAGYLELIPESGYIEVSEDDYLDSLDD